MVEIIVGGILEKDNKYLLVQEAKSSCYGMWNIPAGHLEVNETIFEGIEREINEETGIKTKITGLLQITNGFTENKEWLALIFKTELVSGEIKFDSKEILQAKWFSYEEIINIKDKLRSPKIVIDSIEKLRENKVISIDMINIERK